MSLYIDLETSMERPPALAIIAIEEDGEVEIHQLGRGDDIPDSVRHRIEETDCLVGHNIVNFDIPVLLNHGLTHVPPVYDTLIGEGVTLLQKRAKSPLNLAACLRRHKLPGKKSIDHTGWFNELTQEQLDYIQADIQSLRKLKEKQEQKARRYKLEKALDKEQQAARAVAIMKWHGMPFNFDLYNEMMPKLAEDRRELEKTAPPVNVRSNPAIKKWFQNNYQMELEATDKVALTNIINDHGDESAPGKDAQAILDIRQIRTVYSMYDKIVEEHVIDDKVYPSWWQMGTDNIRFSCSGPNVQQVPRSYRHVFSGPSGSWMVRGDVGGLEAMTTATAGEDPVLMHMLINEMDVLDEITKRAFSIFEDLARDCTKACFYAWLYGGGKAGVRGYMSTRLPRLKGKMVIHPMDVIADLFPACKKFRQRQMQKAKRGPLTLPWGHLRYIPGGNGPAAAAAIPQALGGAGLKECLILMQEERYAAVLKYLCALVHDEIVLGPIYDYEEALQAADQLRELMKEGFSKVIHPDIPIRVSVEVQEQWKH